MAIERKSLLGIRMIAGCLVLAAATASTAGTAQAQRYEPSRPTVSPYLNLFQNNRNGRSNSALPNYYSFVRPLQQQNQTNRMQQQLVQQQGGTIGQLQSNVQLLQKQLQAGPLVAPTGHSSWFENPGSRAKFRDTSRYYLQSGTAPGGLAPRR
ncbi:MAG: hypothetical protein WD468_02595 [Pirellulales bacterium]